MPSVLVQPLWLGFATIIDILMFSSVNVSQFTNLSSVKEMVRSLVMSFQPPDSLNNSAGVTSGSEADIWKMENSS